MEPTRDNTTWSNAVCMLALLFMLPLLLVNLGERAWNDAARPAARERLFAAAEAGDVDDVRRILHRKGIDVNAADQWGCTPLFLAARAGRAEMVRLLIAHGADVEVDVASTHFPPLIRATMNEHADVVDALLAAGADPDVRDRAGCTALWYASTTDNGRIVSLLRAGGAEVAAEGWRAECAASVSRLRLSGPNTETPLPRPLHPRPRNHISYQ